MEDNQNFDASNIVDAFLPSEYQYKVISFEKIESSSLLCGELNFDLEVRVNVDSVDGVKVFCQDSMKGLLVLSTPRMEELTENRVGPQLNL